MADILQNHYTISWIKVVRKCFNGHLGQDAFERLKMQVTKPPEIYFPDFNRPFVLVTDASTVSTGAMLAQRDRCKLDGPLNPVAFFHHTLYSSERNYSTTDRELLSYRVSRNFVSTWRDRAST